MWFGYNPQIIFYYFFCYFNLGIFLAFNNGGGHKFSEFACFKINYYSISIDKDLDMVGGGGSVNLPSRTQNGPKMSYSLLV